MEKPKLVEKFADNGEHSHWELVDNKTGQMLWRENDPMDEKVIIEGHKFRRGDICDIYDIERDKQMFFNRDAGFIVSLIGNKKYTFGEKIPYDSYPGDIGRIKDKWEIRMKEAVKIWRNS